MRRVSLVERNPHIRLREQCEKGSVVTDNQEQDSRPWRWQRATLEMIQAADLEGLFDGVVSVHARDLGDVVFARLGSAPEEWAERPLFEMLAAILGMHETATKAPPFGPMLVLADGSRSAAPEDFAGPMVEVIVAVLEHISHSVVRARLAHLAWFLERRRKDTGHVALNAYVDVIEGLDSGRLEAHGERSILSVTERDLLRMAYSVCHGLGRPVAEHDKLKAITTDLLRKAGDNDDGFVLHLFSDLALDETAMPAEAVAGIVDAFIERTQPSISVGFDDHPARLWLLLARARWQAKDMPAAHAAKIRAAECYAQQAEAFVGKAQGALLAAHWMGTAIATLHGVPDVRQKRQELRHRLIDMQGGIQEDLVPVSHQTDISDLVKDARQQFVGLPLHEALRRLTVFPGWPPAPENLEDDARKAIAEFPLASLFEAAHMDAEGKTVARAPGGAFGLEGATPEAMESTIMRAESTRWAFAARAAIDVARSVIMQEHCITEDCLLTLLRHSPALPPRLVQTAIRGFLRWFEGDMVAALYILTPMLEGILRHLLKQHGHDVTTMDDATKTQEDRTITGLFDALRPELDDILGRALTEDIRRTFLSKLGPSLRHGVAHALLSDGVPYGDDANYACWLIWLIVVWPLLPHWDELHSPTDGQTC